MNLSLVRCGACLLVVGPAAAVAQWSSPVSMPNVNSPSGDFGPYVTLDGMTLYFSSNRNGNYDLFRATRTAPYAPFSNVTPIPELNTTSADSDPCVRLDHREIFFYSNRTGGTGSYDLWRADRPAPTGPFNAPVPVTELNSTALDLSPCLTLDGLRIYFYSTRPGGSGGYDIWTATRPSWLSPFNAPVPVSELNTALDDRDPQISPDGLTMLFTSSRAGGVGKDDTWIATRLDLAAPFGNLVNLTVLNTIEYDQSPAFATFHDEIFFTSNQNGGGANYDLYVARFTGLVGLGIAGPSSVQDLKFSDPSSPGLAYAAASALGSTPGIPLGTRNLPLNADPLFQLTVGGLPPLMTGYQGLLDNDGVAAGKTTFTGFPQAIGLRMFTAFVVLDASSPFGIKTISNAHELRVQ